MYEKCDPWWFDIFKQHGVVRARSIYYSLFLPPFFYFFSFLKSPFINTFSNLFQLIKIIIKVFYIFFYYSVSLSISISNRVQPKTFILCLDSVAEYFCLFDSSFQNITILFIRIFVPPFLLTLENFEFSFVSFYDCNVPWLLSGKWFNLT